MNNLQEKTKYTEQEMLQTKLLELLKNTEITLTANEARYLNQLINLEISVLSLEDKLSPNNLSNLTKLELFTEIADYNFRNRTTKLIKESLKNTLFSNMDLDKTEQFYKEISVETFSLNSNEDTIDLFKIYHDKNNCYGQEYLIDLRKIEVSNDELKDLTDTEILKIDLSNYIYSLILEDFGIKDSGNINAKRDILLRYSVNTSIYSVQEIKSKVRIK